MEENLSYKRLLISTNTDSCPLKVFFKCWTSRHCGNRNIRFYLYSTTCITGAFYPKAVVKEYHFHIKSCNKQTVKYWSKISKYNFLKP